MNNCEEYGGEPESIIIIPFGTPSEEVYELILKAIKEIHKDDSSNSDL